MPLVSPRSRLHRAMKGIERLEEKVDPMVLKRIGVLNLLAEGDECLGIYWNKLHSSFVVITMSALIFLWNGKLIRFGYDQMESSLINGERKEIADEVEIRLKSGDVVKVTIDGGDGKFRDVFSFGRFIDRVISDQSRN